MDVCYFFQFQFFSDRAKCYSFALKVSRLPFIAPSENVFLCLFDVTENMFLSSDLTLKIISFGGKHIYDEHVNDY